MQEREKPLKHVPKPDWLKIKLGSNVTYQHTREVLSSHMLHTICSSGRCPNQGECWSRGTASFMIGGDVCTRSCRFCNTKSGRPAPLNPEEPSSVAHSMREMKLRHAVITSVDRDDLPDGGSLHWQKTIDAIRTLTPQVSLEVLIPDFGGSEAALDRIISSKPDIISHNMETVRRLTPSVRSVATYERSLAVLRYIASKGIVTKTGFMLGLGETYDEVLELLRDIKDCGVSVVTIGQYLQPTRKHLPVVEYVHPDVFNKLKDEGMKMGFRHVESGPLVRSSYHAERHML